MDASISYILFNSGRFCSLLIIVYYCDCDQKTLIAINHFLTIVGNHHDLLKCDLLVTNWELRQISKESRIVIFVLDFTNSLDYKGDYSETIIYL